MRTAASVAVSLLVMVGCGKKAADGDPTAGKTIALRQARSGSSAFSPTDVRDTIRWLANVLEDVESAHASGKEEAIMASEDALVKTLNNHVGVKVAWEADYANTLNDGMAFRQYTAVSVPSSKRGALVLAYINAKGKMGGTNRFRFAAEPWHALLKGGDKLRVTGTVAEIKYQSHLSGNYSFDFFLTDYSLSK